MEQCWGNKQPSAKPAPNWLMKRKLGLPPETISIAMGMERKLCCRLWATHCGSLASESQRQRGAGQRAWGSHPQPLWMHQDGVWLPPPTLLPLKRNRCHVLWALLFPLDFFQGKNKRHSASARVLIATTSNGLTFLYFLCNKVIQETSQQEFFLFRKSSEGAHSNWGTVAITGTMFFIFVD